MTKTKDFDCVEMKRRVQKEILEELDGHSPEEQVAIIKRLADESPFIQRLRKTKTKTAARSAKATAKQRKTG